MFPDARATSQVIKTKNDSSVNHSARINDSIRLEVMHRIAKADPRKSQEYAQQV
jgi:hypothetical protein